MIKEILKNKAEAFEIELRKFFDSKKGLYPPTLYTSMEYSLFGRGKRIRPVLMWLVSDFLDMNFNKLMDFAIALELIHTYSLIHDDLPCMDNDDYRRGKPTLHKMYGEAEAILAGDALLNLAYETILTALSKDNKLYISAQKIALFSGSEGMIGGQVEDITMNSPTAEEILEMYKKKTGCLIKAATLAPCYLHQNEEIYKDLELYGEYLGLIFQLSDDVLDKGVPEKNSYILNMGEEATKNLIIDLNSKIQLLLQKYGEKGKELAQFAQFISTRNR